jgi:hypothetical protein
LDSITTITNRDSSNRDNLKSSLSSSRQEDTGRLRFISRNSASRNNSLAQNNNTNGRRESQTPTAPLSYSSNKPSSTAVFSNTSTQRSSNYGPSVSIPINFSKTQPISSTTELDQDQETILQKNTGRIRISTSSTKKAP